PMAWDSTGTALRFLDYNAEAIRTYDTKSGALSAFHMRDPFLLREVWRGIEAPETRAIVWWDPEKGGWQHLDGVRRTGTLRLSKLISEMEGPSIDSRGQWMAYMHDHNEWLWVTAIGEESRALKPITKRSLPYSQPVDHFGGLPAWQPDAAVLWFVRCCVESETQIELMTFDPVAARHPDTIALCLRSLGPLTGGQVLHIAIAPGGKRIAWLTATGIYTADVE
ncbi:MAG: hypothetical protein HKN20_09505, partial [Gemmatimonadetes bacterium]|nr:hypothetical protein [Gemmatimonadota bacterium]